MSKNLVLLTSGFPYEGYDLFLESELPFLISNFEKIYIITPKQETSIILNLSDKVEIYTYKDKITFISKFISLFGLFSKLFWEEIKYIKNTYKLRISIKIVKTALFSLYRARFLMNLILKKNIEDAVYYSYWCDHSAIAIALLNQLKPSLKTITRGHGWDIYFNIHEINYLPFRNLIGNEIKLICPISEHGKKIILNEWKINPENIIVSRLGVLENRIFNIKTNEITIVSCSFLIPLKRVLLIAKSVILFDKERINWYHFGDGPEISLISQFIEDNKKANHNVVFMGQNSNKDVLDFYQNNYIDVFINVSISEGIPVSIMEAYSCGIPAIATDVGGNSEIVTNENGFIVNKNVTPKDIKHAIQEIISKPEKRKLAYETWQKKYFAKKNYEDFVTLIKSL